MCSEGNVKTLIQADKASCTMQWQFLDSFQILIRIQLKANSQGLGVLQESGPIE